MYRCMSTVILFCDIELYIFSLSAQKKSSATIPNRQTKILSISTFTKIPAGTDLFSTDGDLSVILFYCSSGHVIWNISSHTLWTSLAVSVSASL